VLTILSAAEAREHGKAFRSVRPRGQVIVVGDNLDDATIWATAVAVAADHVVFLPDAEPWLLGQIAQHAAVTT
jgi:hypothetical protein